MSLLQHHLEDLLKSGLSDATIKDSGCRSATREEAKKILGFDPESDAMVFPYYLDNGHTFLRFKPDVPYRAPNWEKPAKYLTPKGASNHLYIPPNLDTEALQDPSTSLLLTEGEKKALAANQEGFPCVAFAGVWCWKSRDKETRESWPIADLDRIVWKGRAAYIVYDSDTAHNWNVRLAEWKLAEHLESLDALVKIVRLPSGPNGEKQGLDDFLVSAGRDRFEQLLLEAGDPVEPVSDSWRPWFKVSKRGRTLLPGVLASILAETERAAEDWDKWRKEGKPVDVVMDEIRRIADGASIIFAAREFYIYTPSKPGVWMPADPEIVKGWVTEIIGSHFARISGIRDVLEQLQGLAFRDSSALNSESGYLNLRNGMLNLETYELESHRKEAYSTIQLDVVFDKEGDCPRFKKFLDQVIVDENMQPDREAQAVAQEFAGYSLTTDTRHEKALLLEGDGSNGKSVLLGILEKLVGRGNLSCVPLERLDDQFRLAQLHGKLLNLAAEVPARGRNMINADLFKQIVSGDLVQAAKKFKPPFTFHPVAKHIFAMNTLPRIYDTSHGFWRRILVVRFRRTFSEPEQDKDLAAKLGEEMPGILNWALAGLCMLRERGRFTDALSVREVTEEFRRQSNPVSAFVEECCEVGDPEWWTSSTKLYDAYKAWADENGLKPLASNWFGRDLPRHDTRIHKSKAQGERGWEGIKLIFGQ